MSDKHAPGCSLPLSEQVAFYRELCEWYEARLGAVVTRLLAAEEALRNAAPAYPREPSPR